MKKTIDGITYDTEQARVIADFNNMKLKNDRYYYCELLYKTLDGKFFEYVEEGAQDEKNPDARKDIIPLTKEEAREWLQVNEIEADLDECIE